MNNSWRALMRASLQPCNPVCLGAARRPIMKHDQAGTARCTPFPAADRTRVLRGRRAGLCAPMNEPDAKPDPPLTPEQAKHVSQLKQENLWEIDGVLIAQSAPTWRKVAHIVGMTIGELSEKFPNIPDVYYAQRVRRLVAVG